MADKRNRLKDFFATALETMVEISNPLRHSNTEYKCLKIGANLFSIC